MGTWSFGSSPYHQYPPIYWKPSPIAFRRCRPLGPSWASRTMPLLTASMPASARSMPPMPTKSRLEARQKKGSKVTFVTTSTVNCPTWSQVNILVSSIWVSLKIGHPKIQSKKSSSQWNSYNLGGQASIFWHIYHLVACPASPSNGCSHQQTFQNYLKKKYVFLCGRSHYDHIISLLNPPKNTYCWWWNCETSHFFTFVDPTAEPYANSRAKLQAA